MKCLALHDELSADERLTRQVHDPQSDFIYRAFLIAHGIPRGPISTLTTDHRVRMETPRRVPVA
jgi:hypothetical protein